MQCSGSAGVSGLVAHSGVLGCLLGSLVSEGDTLFDVLLELGQARLDELLLRGIELADRVDLLHAVGAESDLRGEEGDALVLVQGRLDEGGCGLIPACQPSLTTVV